MKKIAIALSIALLSVVVISCERKQMVTELPYQELSLGSIKPEGWLKEMLIRQRDGMTSKMDELYPQVMGKANGWLGGDGDQWERGPYWIDGLVPMAYILEDTVLINKARPWIEWTLNSQREDGFFGPELDYDPIPGIQRNNSKDWWPRMVVLKFLQQYYSATSDVRVIEFMKKYFQYQLHTLPSTPLGNWTYWAEYRACDNLNIVIWLYRLIKEDWLLDLAHLLHDQSIDYVSLFLEDDALTRTGSIHCVNLAQGIKEPVVYWQINPQNRFIDAVKKAFEDIKKYNGFPCGMYGGDEALHGNNPTQGSELCSAVELMFSLEEMAKITGDIQFVEHLERVAFNALPTQISDDFMTRQYFQQANQVIITKNIRNFDINHGETDLLFGFLTGYPCCTSNLHQAWPKFTQNLWYATKDNGLAALTYSPSSVSTRINDTQVKIIEQTNYPMEGEISFRFSLESGVEFPLHLRIPTWTKNPSIKLNGESIACTEPGSIMIIKREWNTGDVLDLFFPMEVSTDTWYENAISVERGPLVYALRIEEEWKKVEDVEDPIRGDYYYEVYPRSEWNYGIIKYESAKDAFKVVVDEDKLNSNWYWNLDAAPITIEVDAKRIPYWKLYNNMAGPLPYSNMYNNQTRDLPVEKIYLIPYGCTTLRISEFPII